MSVHLRVLPAVLFDPDVLLVLGQKVCSIVRENLILDNRMEEICNAVEREGRTLSEIIDRINASPFDSELDEAAMACEKACALLKAGIQVNLFINDTDRALQAATVYNALENQTKSFLHTSYQCGDRIRNIIEVLGTDDMQQALINLDLLPLFNELKDSFNAFNAIRLETVSKKSDLLPPLRSAVALYGMLVDTLIANVRFENYQLLHRVEGVLGRIEAVINEAVDMMIDKKKKGREDLYKQEIAIA